MKILHVGKYFPPYRGGMETVLENLVEGLLDAGVQVNTVVSSQDTTDSLSTIRGPESGNEGQLIRTARAGNFNSQPLNLTLISQLRRQLDTFKPDLVHLHLPNPLAVLAWSGLSQWYGSKLPPLAIWYHADITRQRWGAKLVRPLIQKALGQCAGICVSTETLGQNSVCLQNFASKIEVIPFGIQSEPWISIHPQREKSFLFVGRLVPYKGLEVLLDAMKQVPDCWLDVVGQGPLESFLEDKIRHDNLEGRVTLHGGCSAQDLSDLMSRAQALILPSLDRSETFGLVQLEAMAAGIPVITSKLQSGVSEVGIEDETCLLVQPGDAQSLSQAMQKFLNDDQLAAGMGQASRERFNNHYTREIMVRRVWEWYEKLLNTGPSKGTQ